MSENQCFKYSFRELNGKLLNKKKQTIDRHKYICSPTDRYTQKCSEKFHSQYLKRQRLST